VECHRILILKNVFDLIVSEDDDMYPEHYGKLRENIEKANKYQLADELESQVVESFLT